MRRTQESFLAWPGWRLLGHNLILAIAVALWWVLVYHGANWLTEMRSQRFRVHWDVELAIPFVPAFILVYLSMDLVFVPAPFILRARQDLDALAASLAAVTAVAGVGFLLFPAELAYPRQEAGAWTGLVQVAREMALAYNLLPSLHVAMSSLCLAAYADRAGVVGKTALGAWTAAIAGSTLLTHQHHVLDVITGLALGLAGKRVIYDRWRIPPATTQISLANRCDDPAPLA